MRRAIAAGQVAEGSNDAHVSYWLDRYAMVVADGTHQEAAARAPRKRTRQSA